MPDLHLKISAYATVGKGFQPLDAVRATQLTDTTAELREHASFMPLAPGDIVRFEGDEIVGIEHLEKLYTWEVEFALPADTTYGMTPTEAHPAMVKLAALEESWQRDTWVTRTTNFSMIVSSSDRDWLTANVDLQRYVDFHEQIRTPATRIDFAHALAHPAL